MIVSQEENAPSVDVPHPNRRTLKVLLSPLLQEGLHALASGLTILPPGGKSDLHEHSEGEMFYVLDGGCTIVVGIDKAEMETGTAAWGPPHVLHQLMNDTEKQCRVLWVLVPPGRERAIIESSRNSTVDVRKESKKDK
jgi:quercetin dioxygenase-like cupin family protein